MDQEQRTTLGESKDPLALLKILLAAARAGVAPDHRELLAWLSREDFLSRLDSDQEYAESGRGRLRIDAVLDALAKNRAPSAAEVLLGLTQSPGFNAVLVRTDLLITACAGIRPPPVALLKYWDDHSRPLDGFTPLTIQALVINGTAPAMALLERKFNASGHSDEVKKDWMRDPIVPHRNDVELLRACQRMLARTLSPALRPELVAVLFDYRPDDWYSEHSVRTPPSRLQASPEARKILREITEDVLANIPLDPLLKIKVEAAMEELKERS